MGLSSRNRFCFSLCAWRTMGLGSRIGVLFIPLCMANHWFRLKNYGGLHFPKQTDKICLVFGGRSIVTHTHTHYIYIYIHIYESYFEPDHCGLLTSKTCGMSRKEKSCWETQQILEAKDFACHRIGPMESMRIDGFSVMESTDSFLCLQLWEAQMH
jgi:hypothetical protein